ncbi:hypothetical protein DFQ27_004472 [Actinomortierella ambigua]|uniref:K Homology domain-containing protein n=1 Tax=Actinomortierella ambigua TaxID=1343610 RepID=A0A9P6Q5X8_9FUNG|nr:hypothetical protein DFQ27_004472 [Actinomortierella ambigua]
MTINRIGPCRPVLAWVCPGAARSPNKFLASGHRFRPFSSTAFTLDESSDHPRDNHRKSKRQQPPIRGNNRRFGAPTEKYGAQPRKYVSRWERERIEEETREKVDQLSSSLYSDYDPEGTASKNVVLSASAKVAMEDLMALKPEKNVVTPEEFDKVRDQISRAFKVDQLRQILETQKIPATGKKAHLVTQVAMLMGLEILEPPKPAPVMEDPLPLGDYEGISQICPSSRQELFFILGSEPGTLQKLEREKCVRISINIMDETYTIRGSEEAVQDAKARIKELVTVTEENWDISAYPREPDMTSPRSLEEIARRSGTYVTLKDDKTLLVAGRTARNIEEAKQLFDLKAHKPAIPETNEILTLGQDDFAQYGMYPIYDPLLLGPEASRQALFRINENGQSNPDASLKLNSLLHPVQASGARSKALSELGSRFETFAQDHLKDGQRFELSARFGHLLFHNPSDNILKVPVEGAFTVERLESWLEKSDAPRFFDSFPFFKVVSQLRRVEETQRRTIEVDYVNSPRYLLSNKDRSNIPLAPVQIVYEVGPNSNDHVVLKEGKRVVSRLNTNLMMLTRPADIQIRGEVIQTILSTHQELIRLASESSLVSDRLVSPPFFSFGASASVMQQDEQPAASQVGLLPTHTLQSVRLRVTREFDFGGFTLAASDVQDQLRPIRRQELVLLPKKVSPPRIASAQKEPEPTNSVTDRSTSDKRGESEGAVQQKTSSPLENWSEFMSRALDLSSQL